MAFATTDHLERYLSVYGLLTYSDHDEDGSRDEFVLDDCQTYATAHIQGRLSKRYTAASLVNAAVLPEIETIITLRELCLRRGNAPPESLEYRYQEITKDGGELDKIASGKIRLVDTAGNGIARKAGGAMRHSNLMIDRRHGEEKVRVVTGSSNLDPTKLERDLDSFSEHM